METQVWPYEKEVPEIDGIVLPRGYCLAVRLRQKQIATKSTLVLPHTVKLVSSYFMIVQVAEGSTESELEHLFGENKAPGRGDIILAHTHQGDPVEFDGRIMFRIPYEGVQILFPQNLPAWEELVRITEPVDNPQGLIS